MIPPVSRHHREPSFQQKLDAALNSSDLETALVRALPTFRAKRAAAFVDDDFYAIQDELANLRGSTVERLPELAERFVSEARKVGAIVHQARDAAEACEIIGQIARDRGARLAVKSKSMATEEIELNTFLEERGVKVVETDLGEWIIQLAHEHPSHLLAPALHKTREQVSELFSAEVGHEVPAEAEALVRVARERLRESFVNADLGISGANMAIADSGTLVIVSNEGNGRLVTTLPPVHIAVVGYEKIVADLDEATALLKVLARNATGQKMPTYVSYITGPSRSADIELSLTIGVHGPKEVHIVLIDNGRWAMHRDPAYREALQCIRCGACANVCPPYQVVGGHVFGHRYTGPIGLVLTAFHHGIEHAAEPQALCASCNACETVCPVGIPIARMILDIRRWKTEQQGLSPIKKRALQLLADPKWFDRAVRAASLAQLPFSGGGEFVRLNIPAFSSATNWRSLPALAREPLRDRVRGNQQPKSAATIPGSQAVGKKIIYFSGCITDRLYPEMGEAVIRVLQACGAKVSFPVEQNCCGLPAINSGDGETALVMIRQTIAVLERELEGTSADYILSGSASCTVSMLQDFPRLLANETGWLARAERLGEKVIDFTSFIDRVAKLPPGALAAGPEFAVTYHDSCQSANCLRLATEPRRIITEVLGLKILEMHESSACCGFGGSFSIEHPRVAERVLRRKLMHVEQSGARVVIADNPGCIMQLRGGLQANRQSTRMLHLAELIAERLPAPSA